MRRENASFSPLRSHHLTSINVNQYIGNYIRFLRKSHHLTQKNLAAMLDITYQQIQKYENGTCNITLRRLCEICESLKMPIADAMQTIFQLEKLAETHPPEASFIDFFQSFRGIHNEELKHLIFELCKAIHEDEMASVSQGFSEKAPRERV